MKVIIAAAGTAGHINPGIAIANKIKKEIPNSKIIFIGTIRGLENDLVPRAGYELKTIEAYGIQKRINITNIKNFLKTIKGFSEAKEIIKEEKPDLVIGTGGYICGAVLTAAVKQNIPTMLHESNAYPGLAVRMLAKRTTTIMVGFKEAKEKLTKAKRVVLTGTPTKISNTRIDKDKVKKDLGITNDLPIVLIFGGSQGAKAINDIVLQIIKNKLNKNYQIIWAPGKNQYEIIKSELLKENIDINNVKNAKIIPYIYNMQEMMAISDLIIARSGAMTITELSIMEKPAIFIPLPSRNANRQEDNARVLEKLNAARVILEEDLSCDKLEETIEQLIVDRKELEQMGKNGAEIAIDNAEDKIFEEIKNIFKGSD
ncbi:MAG: undecaprenyldiphospho-muramoylpentapeptide beta-N-acetylglucosaminyltransferase [Clostridia bacterium]